MFQEFKLSQNLRTMMLNLPIMSHLLHQRATTESDTFGNISQVEHGMSYNNMEDKIVYDLDNEELCYG